MTALRFLALLLIGLISAPPAHARQVADAPLRELAAVLLDTAPDGLLLGRLPDNAPFGQDIVAGMRIVGAAFRSNGSGSAVLAVTGDSNEAEALIRDRLLAAGWTRPLSELRPFGGGFMSSVGPGPSNLCLGEVYLTVSNPSTGGPPGGSYMRVNWNRLEGGYGPCAPPDRSTVGYTTQIPALQSPEGILVRAVGVGASVYRAFGPTGEPSELRTEAVLLTGRPMPPILEHYSTELTRHGFMLGELESADFAMNQVFTWTDDRGQAWEGELLLVRGRHGRSPAIHATLRMRNI